MSKVDIASLDPTRSVVVATGNAHKVTEIEAILSPVMPDVTFYALGQLGDFPEPEENGSTFTENAIIKAEAASEETGLMAVADDSGLMVDALDGAPGIMSARFAGVHGDDARNNAKLLELLADVPDGERTARFHSSAVLLYPNGLLAIGEGDCEGKIARETKGTNGFGYDPLFMPDAFPGKHMAELSPEQKNSISHRYYALTNLASQLG